jgi:nucleotide-binding universal stress UspA family protein
MLPAIAGMRYEIHTAAAAERVLAMLVVRVATEFGANFIVLKTYERTGLSHLIILSVADEVVPRPRDRY